ncbi:glycerol-3-phosphate 1-O-acyltransferase PlsY [cf. Phormidesmis sp. LEGE 11477]|uniref:glycerol-3-phosphate 1-O-acyltransferase PlsY n=1 Tax=cf. Phormidesmis sp. LEGE 11477 TaxID=1828680 RepID=UPI00187EC015|nr:glycerol-3-phosphate 1-O-acyltransferase PlsY [cf. Phormidesmis sp. LEGE 11477]MBE9060145.1 glycerol-3-phosphate 1-O-acyltransferase PlsY [cf. Phormidesmis sp. LEGE 11477]
MPGLTIALLLLALLMAYLLGSIPTGFLLAKALGGIDIREHGSGNTGATNVFRVMGKGAGITALAIDLLKGIMAVWLMRWLVTDSGLAGSALRGTLSDQAAAWACVLAAALAVLGHSKSVWLGFTGGKSAATGLGVLLALTWPVGLSVASVFGVALGISRTVSVGSIAAAMSAVVFMWLTRQPVAYIWLAIAGGLYVVLRHRSNIIRLLEGTEPKTFGS